MPVPLIRHLKSLMPHTLFARSLLILVLPLVLVQIFAVYMFYERHWDSVVRNMSNTLAGEASVLVYTYRSSPPEERMKRVTELADMMGIGVELDASKDIIFVSGVGRDDYPQFYDQLESRFDIPFMVRRVGADQDVLISLQMDEGALKLRTTKKRLVSSTTYIFIMWMAGSAVVLLSIAVLFLRNQIRPIRSLAQAAERFGMGQDIPDFRPRGAAEVRQAGRAFLVMRNRIERQVATRTEMLAGISHDLRTPLTRIKLQLAMLGLEPKARGELETDVSDMEHMIQEYLDFARGEGGEVSENVQLSGYLEMIVEGYTHHQQPVSLQIDNDLTLSMRPKAMRRALQNVIDNALRYGGRADVHAMRDSKHLRIYVDDAGPGIDPAQFDTVFRPFTRLEVSRNINTGGAGLGLSIAQDIVLAHGGLVTLSNRPEGGLRVTIELPLVQTA